MVCGYHLPDRATTYVDSVVQRCENLIGSGIWSGLEVKQLRAWLANFLTPLERYFAIRILDHLIYRSDSQTDAHGGRMIGLFPAGLISGYSYQWLRAELEKIGTIELIHELPERTFHAADVRTYMVIFDKCRSCRPLRLLNHSLKHPEQLVIHSGHDRLDFSYHEATRNLRCLQAKSSLEWIHLRDVASILRGNIATPSKRPAIHTTDYADGFWNLPKPHSVKLSPSVAKPSDILVRRVARNCATTFGLLRCRRSSSATDCVLIIRPAKGADRESLLFSLRVFFGWKWARAFIEKGAGASFISQRALRAVLIPANLHMIAKSGFLRYQKALKKKDFDEMQNIESNTRSRLCRTSEPTPTCVARGIQLSTSRLNALGARPWRR
jgi:hypothetical protein